MSATTEDTLIQPDPYDDAWDDEPITPRAKVRRATKLLLVAAIVAFAFAAGIYADRQWGKAGENNAQAGGFPQFAGARGQGNAFPGAGAFGGTNLGGNADVVTGQVAYRNGNTLYITDTSGNITKVMIPAGLQVSTTATTTVKGIRPGDSVTVRTNGSGGSLTATSVSVGNG